MAGSNAKHPGGRPTVMTPEVLVKLETAFSYDSTIEEACFFADINPDTYYRYVKEHPEFSERVKALRQKPILAARKKVIEEIENDTKNAQWYLERKRKDEFSQKIEQEHSGGEDPVRLLLERYGITEEIKKEATDDRKDDEPIQSSSESPTQP